MKSINPKITLLLLICLTFFNLACEERLTTKNISSLTPDNKKTLSGKVVGISDGDTITLLTKDKERIKIRLQFIDAPESKQDFGQASKKNLSDMIFNKNIQVQSTQEDRYGRTLGKIVYNGKDINLQQIKDGLAWHYKRYQKEQSPSDRKLYAKEEKLARKEKTGLWEMPKPTPPWDWRKDN